MSGAGDSREAALADAKQKFAARLTSGEKMWRPGTGPKLEFASNEAASRYPELRDDFVHNVLGLEWAWISDESSLWDFHSDEDNSDIYQKIGEIYGVDVSHIAGANLAQIFAEITNRIGTFPEDPSVRAVRLSRDARSRQVAGLPALPWNDYPQT
jgi:hypothetical protein